MPHVYHGNRLVHVVAIKLSALTILRGARLQMILGALPVLVILKLLLVVLETVA